MPTLVLPLHRVEVNYLYAVPGVHAEAEELHAAPHILAAVTEIRLARDGQALRRRDTCCRLPQTTGCACVI